MAQPETQLTVVASTDSKCLYMGLSRDLGRKLTSLQWHSQELNVADTNSKCRSHIIRISVPFILFPSGHIGLLLFIQI